MDRNAKKNSGTRPRREGSRSPRTQQKARKVRAADPPASSRKASNSRSVTPPSMTLRTSGTTASLFVNNPNAKPLPLTVSRSVPLPKIWRASPIRRNSSGDDEDFHAANNVLLRTEDGCAEFETPMSNHSPQTSSPELMWSCRHCHHENRLDTHVSNICELCGMEDTEDTDIGPLQSNNGSSNDSTEESSEDNDEDDEEDSRANQSRHADNISTSDTQYSGESPQQQRKPASSHSQRQTQHTPSPPPIQTASTPSPQGQQADAAVELYLSPGDSKITKGRGNNRNNARHNSRSNVPLTPLPKQLKPQKRKTRRSAAEKKDYFVDDEGSSSYSAQSISSAPSITETSYCDHGDNDLHQNSRHTTSSNDGMNNTQNSSLLESDMQYSRFDSTKDLYEGKDASGARIDPPADVNYAAGDSINQFLVRQRNNTHESDVSSMTEERSRYSQDYDTAYYTQQLHEKQQALLALQQQQQQQQQQQNEENDKNPFENIHSGFTIDTHTVSTASSDSQGGDYSFLQKTEHVEYVGAGGSPVDANGISPVPIEFTGQPPNKPQYFQQQQQQQAAVNPASTLQYPVALRPETPEVSQLNTYFEVPAETPKIANTGGEPRLQVKAAPPQPHAGAHWGQQTTSPQPTKRSIKSELDRAARWEQNRRKAEALQRQGIDSENAPRTRLVPKASKTVPPQQQQADRAASLPNVYQPQMTEPSRSSAPKSQRPSSRPPQAPNRTVPKRSKSNDVISKIHETGSSNQSKTEQPVVSQPGTGYNYRTGAPLECDDDDPAKYSYSGRFAFLRLKRGTPSSVESSSSLTASQRVIPHLWIINPNPEPITIEQVGKIEGNQFPEDLDLRQLDAQGVIAVPKTAIRESATERVMRKMSKQKKNDPDGKAVSKTNDTSLRRKRSEQRRGDNKRISKRSPRKTSSHRMEPAGSRVRKFQNGDPTGECVTSSERSSPTVVLPAAPFVNEHSPGQAEEQLKSNENSPLLSSPNNGTENAGSPEDDQKSNCSESDKLLGTSCHDSTSKENRDSDDVPRGGTKFTITYAPLNDTDEAKSIGAHDSHGSSDSNLHNERIKESYSKSTSKYYESTAAIAGLIPKSSESLASTSVSTQSSDDDDDDYVNSKEFNVASTHERESEHSSSRPDLLDSSSRLSTKDTNSKVSSLTSSGRQREIPVDLAEESERKISYSKGRYNQEIPVDLAEESERKISISKGRRIQEIPVDLAEESERKFSLSKGRREEEIPVDFSDESEEEIIIEEASMLRDRPDGEEVKLRVKDPNERDVEMSMEFTHIDRSNHKAKKSESGSAVSMDLLKSFHRPKDYYDRPIPKQQSAEGKANDSRKGKNMPKSAIKEKLRPHRHWKKIAFFAIVTIGVFSGFAVLIARRIRQDEEKDDSIRESSSLGESFGEFPDVEYVDPLNDFAPSSSLAPTDLEAEDVIEDMPEDSEEPVVPVYRGLPSWAEDSSDSVLQGSKPGAELGRIMATSSDGSAIAIGENTGEISSPGTVVRVYIQSTIGGWLEIGKGIELDQEKVHSLDVSDNGLLVAIGLSSSTMVFQYSPGLRGWLLLGSSVDTDAAERSQRLRGAQNNQKNVRLLLDDLTSGDRGVSVAVSADGNTIAVAVMSDPKEKDAERNRGSLNVLVAKYDASIKSWKEVGNILTRKGNFVHTSVSLSLDGNVVAISHKMEWNSVIRSIVEVLEYEEDSNRWDHIGGIMSFGNNEVDVSLSADGTHLAVSAGDAAHSRVYRFDKIYSNWYSLGVDNALGPASKVSIDNSGWRIALQRHDRVSIFDFDFTFRDWKQTGEIDLGDQTEEELKGWNMELAGNGNRIFVGIPSSGSAAGGTSSGLIKVFEADTAVPQLPGGI